MTRERRSFLVRERSQAALTPEDYDYLMSSSAFRALLDAGLVSLSVRSKQSVKVQAANYVGGITLDPDRQLRIEEKVKGSLVSLLQIVHPDATRILHDQRAEYTPAAGVDVLLHQLIAELLRKAEASVTRRLRKEYVDRTLVTSNPRGKLDLRASMPHWAKGQQAKVVCHQHELSSDILINRFVKAALRISEHELSNGHSLTTEVHEARRLLFLMENVTDYHFEQLSPFDMGQTVNQVRSYASGSGDQPLVDAVALAEIILRRLVLLPSSENPLVSIQGAFFVNMEWIFEEALLATVMGQLGDCYKVNHGKYLDRYVLPTTKQYHAEPDVVVQKDGTCVCLLDAKYKDWPGRPDHDDLYEVLAHADSYGAPLVCLVYPCEGKPFFTDFGLTRSGTRVCCGGLRPDAFFADFNLLWAKIQPYLMVSEPAEVGIAQKQAAV